MAQRFKNLAAVAQLAMEAPGLIPSPARWIKGSGVATAAAWIQPLTQEIPYAMGVAMEKRVQN